jgi:hypothetical protein
VSTNSPNSPPTGAPAVNPLEAVSAPGILLIVAGAIGALMGLVNIFSTGSSRALAQFVKDPELAEKLSRSQGASGIIGGIVVIGLSAVVIYGAIQMRQLKNWGLSMAASIIALLPCISCGCCIGLPVGIWALVILNKPEVKAAFK